MDGLAMALHCVWTTESFQDAVFKAINNCGDADTVTTRPPHVLKSTQ